MAIDTRSLSVSKLVETAHRPLRIAGVNRWSTHALCEGVRVAPTQKKTFVADGIRVDSNIPEYITLRTYFVCS